MIRAKPVKRSGKRIRQTHEPEGNGGPDALLAKFDCKMNIHGCLACEYCHTKGNGQCVQKDDMQFVYHELQEAEMLVIAWMTSRS